MVLLPQVVSRYVIVPFQINTYVKILIGSQGGKVQLYNIDTRGFTQGME